MLAVAIIVASGQPALLEQSRHHHYSPLLFASPVCSSSSCHCGAQPRSSHHRPHLHHFFVSLPSGARASVDVDGLKCIVTIIVSSWHQRMFIAPSSSCDIVSPPAFPIHPRHRCRLRFSKSFLVTMSGNRGAAGKRRTEQRDVTHCH